MVGGGREKEEKSFGRDQQLSLNAKGGGEGDSRRLQKLSYLYGWWWW